MNDIILGLRKFGLFGGYVAAALASHEWAWAFAGAATYGVLNVVAKFSGKTIPDHQHDPDEGTI